MWRPHSVVSVVVLATLEMTRIARNRDAVIRNAGDLWVLPKFNMIERVGCLRILARIVVHLVVIRGVVMKVRMTTNRIPTPVLMTKNRNGMIGSLMKSKKASFSSQVIGLKERNKKQIEKQYEV